MEHKGGINCQGDVDVWLVSVLYCHSSLSFATDTRTDNKGVGSKHKGKWPIIPLITRRLWPFNIYSTYIFSGSQSLYLSASIVNP